MITMIKTKTIAAAIDINSIQEYENNNSNKQYWWHFY